MKQLNLKFLSLEESYLSFIEKWQQEPHVKDFWDDGETWEESYERYLLNSESDIVKQFLVYDGETPFGYIQFYWASKVGDGWWEGFTDDIIGIDQYIGELSYLGKGVGTEMIKEFISYLSMHYTFSKIITDPSPKNLRAIRCYEKVGFKKVGVIQTPDGDALLMEYSFESDK